LSDTAIKIENIWKQYRLGVIGHGTLTHDLQSWWAKKRGKSDPNAKVDIFSAKTINPAEVNRFWALKEINLEVKQGTILGIIGKNGAGKSTLLKLLSRVTAPTRGVVKVRGRIASLLEVGTGFHRELTGRENIYLNGSILGMSRIEVNKKLEEIVDFSGIEQFIDTPVKRYSSGMYMRLAFAIAAHLESEILLVDEVLAVGDAEFQNKCLGKMGEVANEGRTVLFVSHNMQAIRKLCSYGLHLQHGEITAQGNIAQIIDTYLSQAQDNYFNTHFHKSTHLNYPPDLEIYKVELLNQENAPTNFLKMGEYITFRIFFKFHETRGSYYIGLVLRTQDDIVLSTLSSMDGVGEILPDKNHHCLTISFKNALITGNYKIDIKVKSAKRIIDMISDLPIRVENISTNPDFTPRLGLISIDATWAETPCAKEEG